MACRLTFADVRWMNAKHPGLTYSEELNKFSGMFTFSAQYGDLDLISDHYQIEILGNCPKDSPLPAVFETEGRIERMSIILNISKADLHVNGDNSLCLIRPDKFRCWYPNGFDIEVFERNLTTHFYWLSYRECFGCEPWKGEEHGGQYNW